MDKKEVVKVVSQVFQCFICMEELQDARICPHCSKLCCSACIKRWIIERHPTCPHCRGTLQLHNMISCRWGTWVEDITQRLTSQQQQAQACLTVKPDKDCEIEFTTDTFCIKNFRQQADPIYSDCLEFNGLSWRLKVYPDGNEVVRGVYLSVFVQHYDGLPEPAKYEFQIELVHQSSTNSSKNIIRGYTSEFKVGKGWGYNSFYRLDLLEDEGYWNRFNDTLILQFHVRAPTYFQKYQEQKWFIQKEVELKRQHLQQIDRLNERLTHELERNNTTLSTAGLSGQISPTNEGGEEEDWLDDLEHNTNQPDSMPL